MASHVGVRPTISTNNLYFNQSKYLTTTLISKKDFRINEQIRVPEVRVIDQHGNQLGVLPTSQALQQANEAGLDLVEVSPLAQPPVVKIVDFGKLQYEQEKQDRKNKAQSRKGGELKGIRLSVTIGEHDMLVRVKNGQKFLDKGNKIKVELQLRGRQKAHPELAKETMHRYIELLERQVITEQPVKQQGGRFSMIIANKKK